MAEPGQGSSQSYSSAAVRGSAWTALQVAISKTAAAAATFFLGFLLQPADFGVAWFAISAGGLATGLHVLAAFDVLVASPRAMGRIAGAVLRMAVLTAAAELVMVAALGALLARTYPDRHGLFALMLVVSTRPLVDAMNVLPMAKMRLGLEYRRISLIDGVTTLVGSVGAVAMAYGGFGAMAIVLPPIAATALRGALYWWHTGPIVGRWSVGVRWRPIARRFVLATFGSYVWGVLIMLDTMILGIFVTPGSLGLFAFASGLATQVNGIVSYHIAGSLHPIFAHLRDQPERQVEGLLRACRIISCILVPILLVQAAVAGPVFQIVWGTRWNDAVPIFMTISVAQAFHVCVWPASFTLKAQGRFRGYLRLQLIQTGVAAVTCTMASAVGGPIVADAMSTIGYRCAPEAAAPLAVAMNGLVLMACFGPLTLWLTCRRTGVAASVVLDTVLRPWLTAVPCAAAAAWAARWCGDLGLGRLGLAALILGTAMIAGCCAIAGALSLRQSTRADARHLVGRVLRRERPGTDT